MIRNVLLHKRGPENSETEQIASMQPRTNNCQEQATSQSLINNKTKTLMRIYRTTLFKHKVYEQFISDSLYFQIIIQNSLYF